MRAAPLRTLITGEYSDPIAQHWTPPAETAWKDLKGASYLTPASSALIIESWLFCAQTSQV